MKKAIIGLLLVVLLFGCATLDPCKSQFEECNYGCGEGNLSGVCKDACALQYAECKSSLDVDATNPSPNLSENDVLENEAESKSAWKSAEPFSIIDFSQSQDGNLSLVVKNNSGSVLHMNSVTVDGVKLMDITTALNTITNFAPNSTRVMTTDKPSAPCQTGDSFSYEAEGIEFDYNTSDISGRRQVGVVPIVGRCT